VFFYRFCITGRPALGLLLALATASFFLCGCGEPETRSDRAADEGVFIMGNGTEPQTLDPQAATGLVEFRVLHSLFEGLVTLDPTSGQIVPAAAEHWEIADDGLTITFYLREDLRWSNGDPLTASDFVFTFKRVLTPEIPVPYVNFFTGIRNAGAYKEGRIADFSEVGVTAPDPRKLVLEMSEPSLFLLSVLASGYLYPVHEASVTAAGAAADPTTGYFRGSGMVSNGPFMLDEWRANQFVRVERNPYFREPAKLSAVEFLPTENVETDVRSFLAGERHKTDTIPSSMLAEIDLNAPNVYSSPFLGTVFLHFHNEKPPLDDPKVRRALAFAIDRESIADELLHGSRDPAYSFVAPGARGWRPSATFEEKADPRRARELLAEAGFPGGEGFPPLEILYGEARSNALVAEAVQQMWREELGIEVGLFNQEYRVYLKTQDQGNYTISLAQWVAELDPQAYLDLFVSGYANNRARYANPKFDRLFRQARVQADPAERRVLFQEAEQVLLRDMPVAPIFFTRREYFLDERVRGWPPSLLDLRPWQDVSFAEE
jgi:oligopeptide transport system substrate-binding protein